MSAPWIALGYCGFEFNLTLWPFDLHIGPMPEDDDLEVSEPVFEAGSYTSSPVGFTANMQAQWERPLNAWDEPSEGHEDV